MSKPDAGFIIAMAGILSLLALVLWAVFDAEDNVEAKTWEDKFREKASANPFPIPADPIPTPAKPRVDPPRASAPRPASTPAPSFQRRVIHPSPAPVPVHIHHHHRDSGGDLLTGVVIGEAIARRDPPAPAPSRSSWRDDTPARSSSSSSSWGSDSSSSSFDSGSSGGSFDSGGGGGFDGGSSGGDF
jgi:uncharacterized membrane protein YgcG